jgi:hypothetical protein
MIEYEAMVKTVARNWYCASQGGCSRPLIKVDVVEMVLEAFQPSLQMAHLQSNVIFK